MHPYLFITGAKRLHTRHPNGILIMNLFSVFLSFTDNKQLSRIPPQNFFCGDSLFKQKCICLPECSLWERICEEIYSQYKVMKGGICSGENYILIQSEERLGIINFYVIVQH